MEKLEYEGPGLFSGATVGGRNPIPNHLECIKTL